ncbi:hypothetical protein RvY_00882-1 [Ramazzottius varieornatus]|uniref:Uncharacterized protein n=1 Tax=Ramazzottius varieornatus TaxID=947166 RepID=A0A1D1UF89_RAMVA|nr:hypothetical protein RvY_00882-1 [Ramazzottius varieornatus]
MHWVFEFVIASCFVLQSQAADRQTSAPCNDHPDCTDPATTCQVMRVPKKDNGIFGIGLQKRCICTEPLRAPCFDKADCVGMFGDIGLDCVKSSICPAQEGISYCRLTGASALVIGVPARSGITLNAGALIGGWPTPVVININPATTAAAATTITAATTTTAVPTTTTKASKKK